MSFYRKTRNMDDMKNIYRSTNHLNYDRNLYIDFYYNYLVLNNPKWPDTCQSMSNEIMVVCCSSRVIIKIKH